MKTDDKTKVVAFRVSEQEFKELNKIAKLEKRKISQVLQLWIEKLLTKGRL